ncbi:NUDIX domain-containing protein [Subtercola lobariae]|uniref:DNA mismatch repair protein MutT n=1 Tax=Subtercola lobariae TaxID=1588641 RepID=A0A917B9V3_9MICO|nr:NUDIX domain-containing protein [Subtercola lobariae]GGF27563.1 DNA mismatch repair protein MutT [Subtercola lobariae]
MPIVSAGILLFRGEPASLEVFVARMGGPFWAKKDERAWSIPKGLLEGSEDSLDAARREFREEIGADAPPLPYELLGDFRQRSGKVVRAFVARTDTPGSEASVAFSSSNTFTTEWPPHSGTQQEFAEIAEARWLSLGDASLKLVAGQVALLDALRERLAQ